MNKIIRKELDKFKGFFNNPLEPVSDKKLFLITNMAILGSVGFIISTFLLSQTLIQLFDTKKIAFLFLLGGSLILMASCIEFFRKKKESKSWVNNLLIGGIISYAVSGFFLIVSLIIFKL